MRFLHLTALFFVLPASGEDHWAYLPPMEPELTGQTAYPIDSLLARKWKTEGISPAELAEPGTWVKRAAYTLTGLPATPEQIARIEQTPDDATWASLIDELLASPAYGERWARHWMDVARYADTLGYNFDQDNRYPFAYTYRDWLIRSLNADIPYSRFIKLQIAADHLTDRPDHPDLAALGFLTVGPRAGRLETVDDRVDVVTRGFLSSTVSCARCHKHKYDPISMEDYYSLYSIFDNSVEHDEKPQIGVPPDTKAYEAFLAEQAKQQEKDHTARQEIVDQIRTPVSSAVYLELGWRAIHEKWDTAKTSSEAFKRGRYRLKVVEKWRDFLKVVALGEKAIPRLRQWYEEMDTADDAGKKTLCLALATEWSQTSGDARLAKLRDDKRNPLSYDAGRIQELMDQEDNNLRRARAGALAKLQIEHPGSPPRAMSVHDKKNWAPARTFRRGDPSDLGEEFERQWLSFLGGGEFPKYKSPRLTLAEKIADPANPLTARVMVNRVWAWHFGGHLADPEDFGVQHQTPDLIELLNYLALRFEESGHSLKSLHRLILTSKAFRLSADGPVANHNIDEANTLFWQWNRRRADFEAMRDRLLHTANTLDTTTTGGRSIILEKPDADRRRSLYAFVDRYALPTTFVSFDLPHPDHHAPKRVETTVPQQALYFLNGPLILRQARKLAADPAFMAIPDPATKVRWLYQKIYQRTPSAEELTDATAWIAQADPSDYQPRLSGTWEIRYAKEREHGQLGEALPLPLFHGGSWKTGPVLAEAPIKWLSAGPQGGHGADGHALILRWRAHGSGEVRLAGNLKRTQKGGVPTAWRISGQAEPTELAPGSSAKIDGKWTKVTSGATIDLMLLSPHGDNHGSLAWNLRILGRETPDAETAELGKFDRDFPKPDLQPPSPGAGDPWADLIQILWASNEFHYIN